MEILKTGLNPVIGDNKDIYSDYPISIKQYDGFRVRCLSYDGAAYEGRNELRKTFDMVNFATLKTFDVYMDYVFKMDSGHIVVVLVNGEIWRSDANEANFALVTDALMGSTTYTNTHRASTFRNIVLVGEYATPFGTLGNKVAISTDYGETFKISLLPEQTEVINHTHAIIYDPYEGIIWVATGDNPTAQRIFWTKDFGETWNTHTTGQYRMTNIIPLPDCVLFGSDEPDVMGVYKYNREVNGVTEGGFSMALDWSHIDAPDAGIIGWMTTPSIIHHGHPHAYLGSRLGFGDSRRVGVWKTDGHKYLTIWEYDGELSSLIPYGVNAVHGPDKYGRLTVDWTNRTSGGYTFHTVVVQLPGYVNEIEDTDKRGKAADKPLATAVRPGTTYWSVDTNVIEVSNGTTWRVV